jgi:YARHG domain
MARTWTIRGGLVVAFVGLSLSMVATGELAAKPRSCGQGDVGDIDMSCRGLWLERNRVMAEAGYCFQTAAAIAVFGRGCFPPYGKLSRNDACYVEAIVAIERRKGCR